MVLLNSRIKLGTDAYKDSAEHATTFRLRTNDGPVRSRATDDYELGENVLVARERIVFTDVNNSNNSVGETISISRKKNILTMWPHLPRKMGI